MAALKKKYQKKPESKIKYTKTGKNRDKKEFPPKRGGGGGAGLQPPNRNLRNADFFRHDDIKFLCDLPFSRNQPMM